MKDINEMSEDELRQALKEIRSQRKKGLEDRKNKKKNDGIESMVSLLSEEEVLALLEALKSEGNEI